MRAFFPLVLLLFVLAACANDTSSTATPQPAEETVPFRTDGTLDFIKEGEVFLTIDIEIAETDSARNRGLMQRRSLPDRSGMLFLFDVEEVRSFWMANTQLSLDIMYVNADSEIVDIAKYTRPLSDDNITSVEPAQYVVEVPAGFSDNNGIAETDRVRWRRQ